MATPRHKSALPSHYDDEAAYYDAHNEDNSRVINSTLRRILKRHRVKTVLDFTCGTGSQVFSLRGHGFQVTGVDINKRMLAHARSKAQFQSMQPRLLLGDMRSSRVGTFDAVITIFNAIGHLTRSDFRKTIKNVARNLKPSGLYIFDIFNLDYLLHENNITALTIDWQKKTDAYVHRVFQHSTITEKGVLTSYTTTYEQKGRGRMKTHVSAQTLQVYTERDLRDVLRQGGFSVVEVLNIDGRPFSTLRSDRMLIVAQSDL